MENIIHRLQAYTAQNPNAPILFDEAHTKGITYARLDDMSSRVYGWLKARGIGTEDFVLIDLPRGVLPVIAMIGVWKAGAAWALVEDTYAPDRIACIRQDCGCRVEISMDNWEDIMSFEPLPGHEEPDPHDAAYAIYTSGTTGRPKGVLHEYGNLQRAIDSLRIDGKALFNEKDAIAILSLLNFVATVICIVVALDIFCGKIYIVSYSTIKNTGALAKLFLTKCITVTFLTPSYVRKIGRNTGPFLKKLFVGSEPANGVYLKQLELINVYAASESGFAVGLFGIDRPYETCPIGKPQVKTKIVLLDEAGNEVPAGGTGELCYEDPYVRGYINLPEETARVFVNGLYHSGDLAMLNENGDYVLMGRSGDMIKINGNRIEPAEIEAAVKEELGIDWCAVRGFEEQDKSYLCAYYIADISFDTVTLRSALMRRLPYYMIPTYFIKIDSVPQKSSGKLDRRALPAPDTRDYQSSYVPPTNETERVLCDAMAQVLGFSRVGIHDDFYELGGDSLASIDLVSACALEGLDAGMVFRGRTLEKIAELYARLLAEDDGVPPAVREAEARQGEHPLTQEQLYMVDYQMYTPDSTMYNLFSMMKLDKEQIDMGRMAAAMKTAIENHPSLATVFSWNRERELVQSWHPERINEIHVERLTEFEFRFVRDMLVYPFKIVGRQLYRCRVFETETAGYVFFDVHHSVFDGSSLKVFMGDVGRAYLGMDCPPDYYYSMLKHREDAVRTDFYEESRRYFESRYDGEDWSCYPDYNGPRG